MLHKCLRAMYTCLPSFLQNERSRIYAKAKNALYATVSVHHLWRSVLSSAALNGGGPGHMRSYLAGSYIDKDMRTVGRWG